MDIERIGLDKYRIHIADGKMDITDPCYDRGTWCAVWNQEVKNGAYNVGIIGGDKERVKAIYAKHEDSDAIIDETNDFIDWEEHETSIGVDSGLCGFFNNKGNYGDGDWEDVCDKLQESDKENEKETGRPYANTYSVNSDGVFSSSGYGDGVYPLFLHRDRSGYVDALAVVFIGDEEVEEEE